MRGSLVALVTLASGAAWAQADEVTVRGTRPADSRALGRAEVREVPGAFGDPFRALDAAPGVAPLITGSPYFYLRGAPPGNVGYFVDGVRVPYLFHVLLGPSVVNPALVSRVELFPGAAPAQYGRYAGGVVAGATAPPADHAHGEAVLRLFDAGGLVETPLDGGRGVALVGGRYSYSALAFSLLSPSTSLSYWDYQLRVAYRVSSSGTVSVFAFGASDHLGERQDGGRSRTVFDGQFHRADLRYDDDHPGGGHTRVALTLGLDRTSNRSARDIADRLVGLRSLTTLPLGAHLVTLGADVNLDSLRGRSEATYSAASESLSVLLTSRRDLTAGAHASVALALGPLTLTPGVRLDLYGSTDTANAPATAAPLDPDAGLDPSGYIASRRLPAEAAALVAVDPRLAARLAISSRVRIVSSIGLAHQPPSFALPLPGYQPSPLRGGLQRSVQGSLGTEVDLGSEVTASLVGFGSRGTNLSDALGTRALSDDGPDVFDGRADGSSYGLEVNLRRPLTRRLSGFASYTLSRTERVVDGVRFAANFDRTHVATAALALDLGRRWRAGVRGTFYTGLPRRSDVTPAASSASAARQPAFHRLDLRLEKRWLLSPATRLSFVAEMLNATLRPEPFGQECDGSSCRPRLVGPIAAPGVGLELVF